MKEKRPHNWCLVKDGKTVAIRRWANGKYERLSRKRYAHLLEDPIELKRFVIRLNGLDPDEERTREKVEWRHAFINDALLDEYQDVYVASHIPGARDRASLVFYLKTYALGFFISKLDLHNPLQWKRSEKLWAKYLVNRDQDLKENLRVLPKGDILSAKVIRSVVNELNRFFKFLNAKRGDEMPVIEFSPLSKAVLKDHEAKRKMAESVRESRFIPETHWAKIKKAMNEHDVKWRWPVMLAFSYGLRRNEAMGLKPEDVRKAYLSCERQWSSAKQGEPEYAPLKNRKPRKIPHWRANPDDAFAWIETMHQVGFLHPDTLGEKFTEFCVELGLPPYVFHDLRRTFITNCVRSSVEPEELRLAVGHSSSQTTYRYYVMDSRELDDEIWVPKKAG